ncbi:MAG: type IV pilus secretin PilQ, partial [Nevskiales bacterium]
NTLLVQETRDRLADIRKLVTQLDVPVKQVQIESRIVVANKDYSHSLGTRFGVTTTGRLFGSPAGTAGSLDGAGAAAGGAVPALADRLYSSFPAPGGGRFSLAILGLDYLVDLELSALQAEGRGEIISTPRVITANGKEATIESGREIPYLEASSSGATSVSFKKAVLSLRVKPQITPDDHILMDINVTNDDVGENVQSGFGSLIPSIDTNKISTSVLVDNGETVVLGGVFKESKSNTVTKVPVFGDLPLVGGLFRTKSKQDDKEELLIFVSPRILKEGLQVNAR